MHIWGNFPFFVSPNPLMTGNVKHSSYPGMCIYLVGDNGQVTAVNTSSANGEQLNHSYTKRSYKVQMTARTVKTGHDHKQVLSGI